MHVEENSYIHSVLQNEGPKPSSSSSSTDMCREWLSIHLRNKSDQLCDFYKNVSNCRTKCTEDFFNF